MDLNSYIVENTEKNGSISFLKKFGDTEVFFGIDDPATSLKDGPMSAPTGFQLQILTANLGIGRMALFFTDKTDKRLPNRFGGMPLLKAAEMVCDLPDVDGILIQSNQAAWFAADKRSLKSGLL